MFQTRRTASRPPAAGIAAIPPSRTSGEHQVFATHQRTAQKSLAFVQLALADARVICTHRCWENPEGGVLAHQTKITGTSVYSQPRATITIDAWA